MNYNKYYAAIEIKDITANFLRRMKEVKLYMEGIDEEELIIKFGEVRLGCESLLQMATELAAKEKPPEREVKNPDRGINEFLEGCERDCDCDSGCSGGCSGCGGKP